MRRFQSLHLNERIPSADELKYRYQFWAPPVYSTDELTGDEQYEATEKANKISGSFKSIICKVENGLIKWFPSFEVIE